MTDEPQIQADVNSEVIDERTLDILFDLHEETVESFRALNATQRTPERTDKYRLFVSALTTEITFLEPALCQSQYYRNTLLGTLEHAEGTVAFNGLASIIEHAEGVTVTMPVQAPGDTTATLEKEQTVRIPSRVLTQGFRALQQWYDDVGLSTEFSEGTDEWEI